MLKVTHNAGFFSNCTIRLFRLLEYYNIEKKLPDVFDCSQQFSWYKKHQSDNIVDDYFMNYNNFDDIPFTNIIHMHHSDQFNNYKTLNISALQPFIKKYFSPSEEIKNIINNIEKKYNITNYDDIITIFYRGNDKCTETQICTHEDMLKHADEIIKQYPDKKILIQSDEEEFIIKAKEKYQDKVICFKDEIRTIKHNKGTLVDLVYKDTNYEFSKYFLAIVMMMAKTYYIIYNSSNCSIWTMYYRGNTNNTKQFLNSNWY
jgi:hypothetical protein